jgi:hypothetical protein
MARYSKGSQEKVKKVMEEMKAGKLKSGRSGRKVTSRKQAIAIGLSEARKEGKKVPSLRKKNVPKKKKATPKKATKRNAADKRISTSKKSIK